MAKIIDLDPTTLGLAPDELFVGNTEWSVDTENNPSVKYTEDGALRLGWENWQDGGKAGKIQSLVAPETEPYAYESLFIVIDVISGNTVGSPSHPIIATAGVLSVMEDGSLNRGNHTDGQPALELWPGGGGRVLLSAKSVFDSYDVGAWEYAVNGVKVAEGTDSSERVWWHAGNPNSEFNASIPGLVYDLYRVVVLDDAADYETTLGELMAQYIDSEDPDPEDPDPEDPDPEDPDPEDPDPEDPDPAPSYTSGRGYPL